MISTAATLLTMAHAAHGVVGRQEALAAGVSSKAIDDHRRRGLIVRVYPGVYAPPGLRLNPAGRARAAVLFIGGDAVASRATAAELLGLEPIDDDGKVHVSNGVRSGVLPREIVLHRSRRFPPTHLSSWQGIPVTTVERTICDLAQTIRQLWRIRKLVGHAVRTGLCTPESLRTTVNELPGFRGRRNLLIVLDELSPLAAHSRSALETLFLEVVTEAGLPPSAMNYPVIDAHGRKRVLDAVYLEARLPIELDSVAYHGLRPDQHDDIARTNALVLAGWQTPLRFTWWDLTQEPWRVVREIRLALERGVTTASTPA